MEQQQAAIDARPKITLVPSRDRERNAHNLLGDALTMLLDALRETQDEGAMQAIGQVLGQVRRIQARMDGS